MTFQLGAPFPNFVRMGCAATRSLAGKSGNSYCSCQIGSQSFTVYPARGCVLKPRVAAYSPLPWVNRVCDSFNSEGVVYRLREICRTIQDVRQISARSDRTPCGVRGHFTFVTQGRREYAPTLGFITKPLRGRVTLLINSA